MDSSSNIVTCVKWVKRGVANPDPLKLKFSVEEIKELVRENVEFKKNLNKRLKSNNTSDAVRSDVDNLDGCMENYDEDDSQPVMGLDDVVTCGNDGETSYPLNLNDNSDSDAEDEKINPDDNLVLIGHVDHNYNHLEVWIHNEENQDFYIHHDVILPSFPLCIEWLNHDVTTGSEGNLCAIGDMDPIINVWDVDIMNCLEPAFKLGKRKKNGKYGHTDAVLSLGWNTEFEHILASGSADNTVILWDIDACKPSMKIKDATKRIESVNWKPEDAHSLLVGSCDRFARLYDCRSKKDFNSYRVKGKIEKLCWDPTNSQIFYVGTSNGKVYGFDVRNTKKLWFVKAHEEEVSGLIKHTSYEDILVSSSVDGTIKYWKTDGDNPQLAYSQDPVVGKVLCMDYNPDNAQFIAVGGSHKSHNFRVINFKSLSPQIEDSL